MINNSFISHLVVFATIAITSSQAFAQITPPPPGRTPPAGLENRISSARSSAGSAQWDAESNHQPYILGVTYIQLIHGIAITSPGGGSSGVNEANETVSNNLAVIGNHYGALLGHSSVAVGLANSALDNYQNSEWEAAEEDVEDAEATLAVIQNIMNQGAAAVGQAQSNLSIAYDIYFQEFNAHMNLSFNEWVATLNNALQPEGLSVNGSLPWGGTLINYYETGGGGYD